MRRSGRLRKGLLLLLLAVVVCVVLVGCARLYLTSRYASSQVADKLQAVLGVPVRIDQVDVGIKSGSSLSRLQVFEADGQRPDTPWLTVQDVRVDLSALDVVGGDMSPQRVVLSGAAIDLRFDADGHLLTALPKMRATGRAFPRLVLERSQLTLDQAGRTPLVIDGVSAEAGDHDGDLVFHGTIHDKDWGDWTVDGTFMAAQGKITLRLKTPHTHITQKKLDSLPFVSPSTWEQVQLDGYSPVDFELQFTLGDKGVHYRVDLIPEKTTVHVTSIDLHADNANGKVTVEDGLVTLRDVTGQTADGTISLPKADLDFRKPANNLTFTDIGVAKVDLRKLPASWNIPLRGAMKLTGKATLQVLIRNGKAHTTGDGNGFIEAVLFNTRTTIDIRLKADENGFHFSTPAKTALKLLPVLPPPPTMIQEQPNNAAGDEPNGPHPLAVPLSLGTEALRSATTSFFNGGASAMAQVHRWTSKLPPRKQTEYLEASVALKDVDVTEIIRDQKVKLPFTVSGKVSFQLQVAIPIDTPNDTRAYKMRGSATSARLMIEGVEMTQLLAKLTYDNGVLSLDELRGQFPDSGGTFGGGGKLQWVPQGDLTLNVRVDRVPVNRVLALLPGAEGKGEGTLSGRFDARVAVKQLRDPLAWEATGTLRSERLSAYGLSLTKTSLGLMVKNGTATTHDLDGELEGGHINGSAEVRWADGYPYKGKVELKDADLAAVQRLSLNLRPALPIEGRAGLTADFQGKLTPLSITASGTARAKDLTISEVRVGELTFQWSQDADRVKLSAVDAKLYDGTVNGSVTIPLKETVAGEAQFKIDAVEVQKLAKVVPLLPVQLEGRISGTVSGTLSASAPGKAREFTTKVDINSPLLQVAGISAEKLRGGVVYRAATAEYHLDGDILGGRFELEGKRPHVPSAPDKPPDGHLRIQGVRLSRLGAALHQGDALAPLSGKVEVDLPYRHEGPERAPVGVGRFVVSELRWAESEVAQSIQGDVRLTDNAVQLHDVSGNFGEGSLRGTCVFHFKEPERSWFNFQLDRVEASRLLVPLLGGLTSSAVSQPVGQSLSPIEGALDVHLRGNLGREWRATGDVALAHGKVYGIEISEWRLPVSLSYSPQHGTGQLDFPENHAQLARGRMQGQASLRWGSGLRLEGSLRFFDVDVPALLRSTGTTSKLAGGRTSGRLDFGGESIRSADDLTATLDASFAQAQPLQLPVLEVLTRDVAPGQSAMTFQKGDLRATLSRGVVRVKRLSLSNAALRMLVEGTVTVQGRVDLEATASTGALGINPAALRLLGVQLPELGPLPLATIVQASAYLSKRVVRLRVTGTVKNPSVQLDSVQLLTEEAIRFFLSGAAGVPMP